jgi:small subunit ribosomal protein S6
MRRYETIVILDPDLSEEERTGQYTRIRELIPAQDGLVVELDEWGVHKMAYAIKKKPRGFYLRIDYCGNGVLVDELERNFRIDDRYLKFMTILLEEDVDLEAVKEAMAKKEAEAAEAAAKAEAEKAAKEVPAPEAAATEPAPKAETEPAPEPATEPDQAPSAPPETAAVETAEKNTESTEEN